MRNNIIILLLILGALTGVVFFLRKKKADKEKLKKKATAAIGGAGLGGQGALTDVKITLSQAHDLAKEAALTGIYFSSLQGNLEAIKRVSDIRTILSTNGYDIDFFQPINTNTPRVYDYLLLGEEINEKNYNSTI